MNKPCHEREVMEKMVRVGLSLSIGQVRFLKGECEKIGSRVGLASLCYDVLCEKFPRLKTVRVPPNPNQISLFGGVGAPLRGPTKKARKGARKGMKG